MNRIIARDLLQATPTDVYAGPLHQTAEQAIDEFVIKHYLSYCYWILIERVDNGQVIRSVAKLQEARERAMKSQAKLKAQTK